MSALIYFFFPHDAGMCLEGTKVRSELSFFLLLAGFTFGIPQIHPAFIQRPYG